MPKYRGSRKNYNVPSNPRLFTVRTGASSGGGDICPRNAAGERVSEAGPGQGPLTGGPRDADGFLKKLYDDEWKDVIYKTMDLGQRQFAIDFMKNDKPAPPGSPNACLSKYERAIIATFNNITTEEINGDIHIDELLKREAGKPNPPRLPKDPLILPGVGTPKGKAESASRSAPQGFQGNTTLARLAALEGAAVQNASFADFEEEVEEAGFGTRLPDPLPIGVEYTFQDRPFGSRILSSRADVAQTWDTVEAAIPTAADEIRQLAGEYYSDYAKRKAGNMPLPEAGVEFIRRENGRITYSHIIVGNMKETGGPGGVKGFTKFTPPVQLGRRLAGWLHFHWTTMRLTDLDVTGAPIVGATVLAAGGGDFEAWVATYVKERRYYAVAREDIINES